MALPLIQYSGENMRKVVEGLLAFFVVAVFMSCASAGKSPVPSVEMEAAVVETPKSEPKFVDIHTWKVLQAETTYPDGVRSAIVRFTYSDKGEVLKEEQFNGNKELTAQKVYTYSGVDTVEIVSLNAGGTPLGKAVRLVDGDRINGESLYNAKGELQSSEEYTYDEKGKKTRWMVKTSSGNEISSEYTWDGELLSAISVLDASGAPIKRFERTYGSDGSLSSESSFDAAGNMLGKTVYIRENNALVREISENSAGGVLSSISYRNDADGNPVEISYFDRNGRLFEVKTQTWQVFTQSVQVQ